jgi:pimeloyl-ACP methyl ester carboxylesterase
MSSYVKAFKFKKDGIKNDIEEFQKGVDTSVLASIKCPTLITHGTHDKMVPFSHAEYVHENISHSELYAIEKGYHSGILYVGEHKDQI